MHTNIALPSIPVARALMIAPWVESVQRLGAPAEALLVRTGIQPEVLRHETAAVPLKKVFCWIELACRSLGTEHLGVHVGDATCNEDLGPYGRMLAGALYTSIFIKAYRSTARWSSGNPSGCRRTAPRSASI